MAIIRIKRTTGNNLPTGLTFGEMAFVQGSGKTANRLYIADNAGVCVWVGAQIINQPTFWTGDVAETTVPTLSAVEGRIVAGGGLTFASNLNVNIDVGKFFGKYKKGDVIPAQGQTVKWVIEDALSETIAPGLAISFSSTTAFGYGQTSAISYTITPQYQIKTVGAVGAGSTFEWRRVGDSGWTAYPGTFHSGTETVGTTANAVGSPLNGVTLNAGGTLDTRAFEYRWSVRDSAGATAGITATISMQPYSAPSVSNFALAAPLLLTAETHYIREKGNTYSTVGGGSTNINRNSTFIPLLQWKLQYSEDKGTSWFDTNRPSAGWQTASSPSSANVNTFHTAGTSADQIWYRFLVIDSDRQSTIANTSIANSGISFGFRIFYGPTGSAPANSGDIRGLPGICMASGSSRFPNPFILNTGSVYNNFIVALPQGVNGLSLSEVLDLDASSQNLISDYRQNISTISVTDRAGLNAQNYTVYRYSPTGTYSAPGNRHQCTVVGSFTNP